MLRPADRIFTPILLTAAVMVINFITMPAEEYRGDAEAVRAETVTLLNEGRWAVPEQIAAEFGPRGQYFYQTTGGSWYPKYGILNTLIYLPPLWLEKLVTGSLHWESERTLYLNLLNLIFSGATAFYLALLALRYTKSSAVAWLFVLASLYATFWWNYLRAQTFEIYLTLFLIAFFYHFVSARTAAPANTKHRSYHLLAAGLYLGALCLSKTAFSVLLPAVAFLWLISAGASPPVDNSLRRALIFWIPVAISVGAVLASHAYKFGSPFHSGYTQWEEEKDLFTIDILPALRGYFFSIQTSVWAHFPTLILAVFGWPAFLKKYRFDALTAVSLGLLILAVSVARPEWRGGSCYGPRYLLPVLPIVSLPLILALPQWSVVRHRLFRWASAVAVAVMLLYSVRLQIGVNSLPFFFWYDLYAVPRDEAVSDSSAYLHSRHIGTINLDFIRSARGKFSPLHAFTDVLEPEARARIEALKATTNLNYFLFPYPVQPAR